MIGIVGVDMGDVVVPGLEFGVVGIFDRGLPILHDLVELLNGRGPGSLGKGRKGFVVVAVESRRCATIEFVEHLFVPEQEMIGKLAYRMAGVRGFPHGLLSGYTFDGFADWDKPVLLVPGILELLQKDRFQSGGCFGLLLGHGAEGKPETK